MEFDKKGILARARAAAKETAVTDEGLRAYICLLYTSPSPRDMRRSRMPSSA